MGLKLCRCDRVPPAGTPVCRAFASALPILSCAPPWIPELEHFVKLIMAWSHA